MLTQRKALVLVTLVLLCCALLNSRWTGWLAGPLTHTVHTLQQPAYYSANLMMRDTPVDYPEMSDRELESLLAKAQKENDALWQENEKLRDQINSFEAIVLATDMTSIRMVVANVGRFNSDPVNPTVLILRGSLHGLKPDDPVAFESNLIGFVTDSIGPANATVSLITREGFSIGVNIMPPPGVEAGEGWPFKTRVRSDGKGKFYCTLAKSVAEELRPGDYVRAADTIRESANGFLLGLIEKIENDPKDPLSLSRVTIQPRAPIGPQPKVTVLTERTD
ncbi:MAG: rod shape-determining protein MreC [Planctomycetota bacterium]